MSATYPSGVKSFTSLIDGTDYPQATDINQAYDEIAAIEQALLAAPLSWTPADSSGASLVLTVTSAKYFRIGMLVFATADITYPASANATQAQISGLPYTSAATLGMGATVNYHNATVTDGIIANMSSGGTVVAFYKGAGGGSVLNSDMSGRTIRFSAIYLSA